MIDLALFPDVKAVVLANSQHPDAIERTETGEPIVDLLVALGDLAYLAEDAQLISAQILDEIDATGLTLILREEHHLRTDTARRTPLKDALILRNPDGLDLAEFPIDRSIGDDDIEWDGHLFALFSAVLWLRADHEQPR